jgi:arylsulfatase A
MRPRRLFAILLAACALTMPATAAAQDQRPPNIVLIVADDLGWADVGADAASLYLTPHIDSLARDGVRFTDAYAAAPVCSPTRAALLTGKYPARLHITDWLPGRPDRPDQKLARPAIDMQLPLAEVTLAEALQERGYVSAHIGKWHLGGAGFGPTEQGFTVNVGGDDAGSPRSYFAPFQRDGRFMPGLEAAAEGEYLTDRLTDEALRFIDANRDRPFFLYLSHYAPHIPLQAKAALVEKHRSRAAAGPQTNAIYAAMIESIDDGVGRVLERLETLALTGRTIVVFTSDNGGLATREGPNTPATSNAPLRNGKGYLQEGGLRVPLIVRWPGQVRRGAVSHAPVSSIDLFPTLLALSGASAVPPVDGVSLEGVLRGTGELAERPLFWHYPHYSNQARSQGAPEGGGPGAAIRVGRWKLIEHFESGDHELYDLEEDSGEATNLASVKEDQVLDLGRQLLAWQNAVKAQWPRYNPEYENPVLHPAADGSIVLHASDAVIHGGTLRYEPSPAKNTLGFWTDRADWVHWDFEVPSAGLYRLDVLQGCGQGSGGAAVELAVGADRLTMTVEDTGSFQTFVRREAGELRLAAGPQRLTVRPRTKPGVAVMDLREVRLVRVE